MSSFDLKLFKALLYEIFFLIALGGGVRAMNAGLACPDWPLCFGQIIPDYHPEVYFEFIHRALAGLVGLISIYLNIKIIINNKFTKQLKFLAAAAVVLLLSQIVMGGLTVLWLLKESVVTAHLGLATAFFVVTLWIYLEVKNPLSAGQNASSTPAKKPFVNKIIIWNWLCLVAIYAQVILGGLVASHYAATSCPDFPKCNGQWVPTLAGPVGLHVMHRLWAYMLTIIILGYVVYVSAQRKKFREVWHLAKWFLPVIILQISVGIANVHYAAPPLITVSHLALATLLLAICTRTLWLTRRLS